MYCIDITLGQGAFGKVVRADAVGIIEAEENTIVAVKMVRGKSLISWTVLLTYYPVTALSTFQSSYLTPASLVLVAVVSDNV